MNKYALYNYITEFIESSEDEWYNFVAVDDTGQETIAINIDEAFHLLRRYMDINKYE